jgi:DNA-binding LacI/PurR family transcriptional regulator
MKKGKVTSHEVAALAGVSRSAVSRTFTPGASVSDKTREKVLDAAAKLGYRPNVIARSLIMRRSHLIGLIMADWENPFYTTMLRDFSAKLQDRNYQVVLLTSTDRQQVDDLIRMLMQYQVEGIIVVSALPSVEVAAESLRSGTPIVLVNREPKGRPVSSVTCDNEKIGEDLADLLIDRGYQRIALVRGDPSIRTGVQRTDAIKRSLRQKGQGRIIADVVQRFGYDAGRQTARELFKLDETPDAIVCSSDLTAFGVLDGVRHDLSLAVPDEVAVIGFGDSPAASWQSNRLTSVQLPIEAMIDASIDALLTQLEADRGEPISAVLQAGIVQRSTVRGADVGQRRRA